MTRRPGILFPVLALLVAALFYASLHGSKIGRFRAGSAGAAPFHGGKRLSAKGDAACVTPQCHAPSAHRKQASGNAFLNMHQSIVTCLGCHGREAESRWKPGEPSGGAAFRLAYTPVPEAGSGGRRHGANGTPAACRRCHSTEGRRAIAAAGVKGLPEGFEDPIALRMIEGGGRKWLPADMR